MAETSATEGSAAPGSCSLCGKRNYLNASTPATACRQCGACLIRVNREDRLQPFVPPAVSAESAWSGLRGGFVDGDRAELTSSRLLMLPFYHRAADGDRPVLLRPAADLLPSGLESFRIGSEAPLRGLQLSDPADHCVPADPRKALTLIGLSETVDVMLPAPPGMEDREGSPVRLFYVPFWCLTYRLDHKEYCGVVDGVKGSPIGPSAPPDRWRPALTAAGIALGAFLLVHIGSFFLASPILRAVLAGAAGWAGALAGLKAGLRRERGR